MALDLDDLELLLDIADCGSFSRAAVKRQWSQPQVSQRVAQIERGLGITLFSRSRRGVQPTPACLAYLPAARAALDTLAAGRAAAKAAPTIPVVTIGAPPSLTSLVFPPLLSRLAEALLEIRCASDHSPVVMRGVLDGTVDVGFILRCPPVAGLKMELLACTPIVPVVAADHPLADRDQVTLEDIAGYRVAPQSWGDAAYELQQRIRALRRTALPLHTVQPASAACRLVLHHGFISFMPELAVANELATGQIKRLPLVDGGDWTWDIVMVYRPGKRREAGLEHLLAEARGLFGKAGE